MASRARFGLLRGERGDNLRATKKEFSVFWQDGQERTRKEMNLALIGLPQSGKKTIFELLTGISAQKAPSRDGIHYAQASVRDPRVDQLSAMYNPKKTKFAEIEIACPPDVQPDTSRAASWINPLRNADGLIHVVRQFESDEVFHIRDSIDPARDLSLVDLELLLADLALVETRLVRMEKENRHKPAAESAREKALLLRFQEHLESEKPLRTFELEPEEKRLVASLQFLTLKPMVVVFNLSEDMPAARKQLEPLLAGLEGTTVCLSASIESELKDLDAEERDVFMQDLGLSEPAAHRLSRAVYEALGLISFFTVGPDEVRAWTLRRGAKAPEAAGKIHSDLERGFIRASTIPYGKLLEAGTEKAAAEANLYVLNGKDYVVQDGDVLEIRYNV